MKIEDIEKAGKIYIENLLDYHIDYTIINNEEDNYEAGREHALSEFGADIFKAGAEWMKKYFSWVSVEERLPEEGQRILVGFLFYYKYYDREAQSRRYIDTFTYKNGVWVNMTYNFLNANQFVHGKSKNTLQNQPGLFLA